MVKETLPKLNPAMLEVGENMAAVANLAFVVSAYYQSLIRFEIEGERMPSELVSELTLDLARNLHQKAVGY